LAAAVMSELATAVIGGLAVTIAGCVAVAIADRLAVTVVSRLDARFQGDAHSVHEVSTTERDYDTVLQRHAMLLQALAIDEGSVAAAEILDVGLASLLVDVGMPP